MNRLMQSEEYNLKPDFGFFNFIFGLSSKNRERVTREFGEYTIKQHVEHMQAFISTLKSFIQIAPATKKAKIAAIILIVFLIFDVLLTIQARERAKDKMKGIEPRNSFEEFLDNTFNNDYLKNMYNNMEWQK